MSGKQADGEMPTKSVWGIYLASIVGTVLAMTTVWLMSIWPGAFYIAPVALFLTVGAVFWGLYEDARDNRTQGHRHRRS